MSLIMMLPPQNDNSVNYRPYAQQFIVLVTDQGRDGSNGENVEADVADMVDGTVPIIVVTDANSADDYDSIAENSGGFVNTNIAE